MVLNLYSTRCTIFTIQQLTGWDHTSSPPLTPTNLTDFFSTGEMLTDDLNCEERAMRQLCLKCSLSDQQHQNVSAVT